MKTRPFGKARVNRWVTRYTHKRYRKRVKQILHIFRKGQTYLMWWEDVDEKDIMGPTIPIWKEINDPWSWD